MHLEIEASLNPGETKIASCAGSCFSSRKKKQIRGLGLIPRVTISQLSLRTKSLAHEADPIAVLPCARCKLLHGMSETVSSNKILNMDFKIQPGRKVNARNCR